ncbi:hypothetical protein [Cohnella abietis]|uniref:Uncharacterized protein n=1 Tax=Cohnella abietis TaxID=2507935 RepID=A0A3T1D911_9BACL|nr:hypothetical protein [Cohnella abietis]BBI34498.1 hypothetical protein KCTCHS21_38970 [Cohnella abietis]
MTENNQFLDPPITPQNRSDEPENNEKEEVELCELIDDLHQNEGYQSICRE